MDGAALADAIAKGYDAEVAFGDDQTKQNAQVSISSQGCDL